SNWCWYSGSANDGECSTSSKSNSACNSRMEMMVLLFKIPLLAEGWMRRAKRRRRRGGQAGVLFAELTTPALRASPPLRGGEYHASQPTSLPNMAYSRCDSVCLGYFPGFGDTTGPDRDHGSRPAGVGRTHLSRKG